MTRQRKQIQRHMPLKVGEKMGHLVIVENLGSINHNITYRCKCICGNLRDVTYSYLQKREDISCGCMNFTSYHGNRKYEPQEASYRAKATAYKAEAKSRQIPFEISIDICVNLLKGICYYCGDSPSKVYNVKNKSKLRINQNISKYEILYNGIDRKDNMKGYTDENCVSCCTRCNTAKLDSSMEEFKEWLERIYKNKNLWG